MGVLAALALVVIVVGGLIALAVAWVVSMAKGPIDATNAFMADLDDGRLAAAYDSLCDEARSERTFEEFQQDMADADAITGYTFASASVRSESLTIVSGRIELDELAYAADFGLLQDGDTWRVCRYDPLG